MIELPLSDTDWRRVQHLFVAPEPASARGRLRRDVREIVNAILWVQQSGEKWHRLPSIFPPQQTCYAKYIAWRRAGLLECMAELISMKSLDQ